VHERVEAIIDASRALPQNEGAWTTWELLPHILRQDDLRTRVADLYAWYRQHYLDVFEAADDPAARALALRYASIFIAVIDGLAMQKALDPEGVDLDAIFDLWRAVVRASLDELLPPGQATA